VDVRIGVTHSPKEIGVELPDGTDREALKKSIAAAIAGGDDVLWLTDRKGREVAIPASKIAYVELGSADATRPVGFGG
jgi:hypothetical protein